MDHVRRHDEYLAVDREPVLGTCLHLATVLGGLMRDDLAIVGGLVPTLLVPQEALPEGVEPHCGTLDVDLGLSLALLQQQRYAAVSERLRSAGFTPDRNDLGRDIRQRWCPPEGTQGASVDFLIPPATPASRPGGLQSLERDFAAVSMPGLHLVSSDSQLISIEGRTLLGERVTRAVRVCGPGAFVVLEARALHDRGLGKDAYDLIYVLLNYGAGVADAAAALRPISGDPAACEALAWLAEDFRDIDSVGPTRAAVFRSGSPADDLQAAAWAAVQELLRLLR